MGDIPLNLSAHMQKRKTKKEKKNCIQYKINLLYIKFYSGKNNIHIINR